MADVAFENVSKEFPGGTFAVDDLTLGIGDGEFLILVGPSGCGKTTALRLIAGLEKPTAGTIRIGAETVNGISARDRDIAMVFQNYALYPHMTVYRNLAFGLRERRTPKRETDRRVREISSVLSLDELLKRRPAQLSGGQRQRVAMGRALVREPKVFLLDEPLSNLDAKLRVQMRAELKRLHKRVGITTVYVTHDQVEAMTLADRIVVMSAGKALQIGSPQEVFSRPVNLFVAGFIGSPAMNLLQGRAVPAPDGIGKTQVTAGDLCFDRTGVPSGDVVVGIRPESMVPGGEELTGPSLDLEIELVEPLGTSVLVHGTVAGTAARSGAEEEKSILIDETSRAQVTAIFPASLQPASGDRVRVGVDPERIYLFDAATGEAIWS
jgi:sn-glycerol 3-phosphate transport system ATP-binding protein